MTAPAVFDRLSALADPIRGRILLALERQELTVRELQAALQLPQSTVSRHLKVLADHGLVVIRSEGTSNWYRMPARELDPAVGRALGPSFMTPRVETDFETFFAKAPRLNSSRSLIKGVICDVRVEDIEEPTMQEIRYLDKLIDELARGKAMEKILRTP